VLRAAVPETAVDEDGDPPLAEDEIRTATKFWLRGDVHAVTQAPAVEFTANGKFGPRVPSPVALHNRCGCR
jgi:hypothetical protein